jgi:hypothetical protein
LLSRGYLTIWLGMVSPLALLGGIAGLLHDPSPWANLWHLAAITVGVLCGFSAYGVWCRHRWALGVFVALSCVVVLAIGLSLIADPDDYALLVFSGLAILFLWRAGQAIRRATREAA